MNRFAIPGAKESQAHTYLNNGKEERDMVLQVPSYYREFHCIAGECKDSCCIGWEIDIDGETESYYREIEGAFGQRLRENMEGNSFTLRENGWCPFLNGEKLCDICIELGEEALSEVCTEYPRFTMEYPGVREKVLCLSCEEAGRIVFSNKEKIGWERQELPGGYDGEDWEEDEFVFAEKLQQVRQRAVELLQQRERPVEQRAVDYLKYVNRMQQELFGTAPGKTAAKSRTPYECFRERLACYGELEVLDGEWEETKSQLGAYFSLRNYEQSHREFAGKLREREYEYEHLLVYFTNRYFMRAFYDDNLFAKAQFAVAGYLLLRDMDVVRWKQNGEAFTLADRIDTVRIYAKEVEHSEENIESLGDMFLFEEVFSLEELVKQILCTESPEM